MALGSVELECNQMDGITFMFPSEEVVVSMRHRKTESGRQTWALFGGVCALTSKQLLIIFLLDLLSVVKTNIFICQKLMLLSV